jgi:glycosyltransferase involved in cell wall biosynthesis
MEKNMTNPVSRDIVISSGHKNFHMLFTAAEMERRGRLARLFCGAYPTILETNLLSRWPFSNSRKINRFINREEALPLHRIDQNRFSEILGSTSNIIKKIFPSEIGNVLSFHIYGNSSEARLKKAAKLGAKIYHYRAGFGQSSVKVAKQLGMTAICDHSIVHPSLFKVLTDLEGNFPKSRPARPSGIWGAVLDDIEAADHILVNSDFVAETFEFMGVDRHKISIVYQGVEDKFMNCLPSHRNFFEQNSNALPKILFAGGIGPRKGVDEIASILKHLSSFNFEMHFAGYLSDQSRQRYSDLFSDPRVTYHGMLNQMELAKLMSSSDIFLFPSRAEGSARVIFEALAAGCVIITTRNSGSIVVDGENGRLVPVNDKEALLSAVKSVLAKPELFPMIGNRNKKLITSSYTQKNYGDNLESVYNLFCR